MKLLLQILIFIGLKFKELLWNIVIQAMLFIIACILIFCGIITSIGAIAYNFVDLTSWGKHVYVLTDSHTFLNYLEVYVNLGGCLLAIVVAVAFVLFIIFCLLWSLTKLIFFCSEKQGTYSIFIVSKISYGRNKIKRFFAENWNKSKNIVDKISREK